MTFQEGPLEADLGAADAHSSASVFDAKAQVYERAVDQSIAFTGRSAAFFAARKVHVLHELLARAGCRLSELSVLDVGCGIGLTESVLHRHVGVLEGVDVSSEMVAIARQRVPKVSFQVYDGRRLPYSDEAFDLAILVCILHHVPPKERPDLIREIGRVVRRRTGHVAIFEHNPLNPLTQHAVRTCDLDSDATLLGLSESRHLLETAAMAVVEQRYCFFTPFGGRAAEAIDRRFRRLPFGGQYVVMARRR